MQSTTNDDTTNVPTAPVAGPSQATPAVAPTPFVDPFEEKNVLREDVEVFLLFEDRDYAHILWSKNLDYGDLPRNYPPNLEHELEPGVMDGLNMSKITRMQRSFRWQPHLPFMPVHFSSHKWAERYNYQYDTLPIVQIGPTAWTLDYGVSARWYRHLEFFHEVLTIWRNHLAVAPMTVNYVPTIHNRDIRKAFDTEKKARSYFWYYRTLIFSMFAEFSFVISNRPNWKEDVVEIYKKRGIDGLDEWLKDLERALGDFRFTKRAGVIIDVATTQLWPFIARYHEKGVPTLMDVGHITFHDRDENPTPPTIYITPVQYKYKPSYWPSNELLRTKLDNLLFWHFGHRLHRYIPPSIHPLSVTRPPVGEAGSMVYDRIPMTPWINPFTDEPTDLLHVAEPINFTVEKPFDANALDWVEFFQRRQESNRRREQNETPVEKQRRESRTKDALKINQIHSSGPSKKSTVYKWVQEQPDKADAGMKEDKGLIWTRKKVDRAEVEEEWGMYLPTQRLYDPFHNQWDLMVLFDVDAGANIPTQDYNDDDDDDDEDIYPQVSVNQPITYLDQINVAPKGTAYSSVGILSSHIAFMWIQNLAAWSFHILGLLCCQTHQPPVKYPQTSRLIGFFIDASHEGTVDYNDVQEFVSYIVARDYRNPRIVHLSDLHPQHPSFLRIRDADMHIHEVQISQTVFRYEQDLTVAEQVYRRSYILTPKHDNSEYKPNWILVIFDATTVVQILRNHWGSSSMENLIRHLICHGVEFRTLVPASINLVHPHHMFINTPPTLPPITKTTVDANDYANYIKIRDEIMDSPHAKPAYRWGGIIWRLAMESVGNLEDIVYDTLNGPSEVGPSRCEYFFIGNLKYFDYTIPFLVEDTICGTHGPNGRSYWPTVRSMGKTRWGTHSTVRGNLMWNHRDEEWFQRRSVDCIAGNAQGQPKAQSLWKNSGSKRHKLDGPFEEYCAGFLSRFLNV